MDSYYSSDFKLKILIGKELHTMNENVGDFEIKDCPLGKKTTDEIIEVFGSHECMECPNTTYKDGVLSCKYSKV